MSVKKVAHYVTDHFSDKNIMKNTGFCMHFKEDKEVMLQSKNEDVW